MVKHPTVHRTALPPYHTLLPTTKKNQVQSVNNAKVEKLCFFFYRIVEFFYQQTFVVYEALSISTKQDAVLKAHHLIRKTDLLTITML